MTRRGEGLGIEWQRLLDDYPDWCIHLGTHDGPGSASATVWAHPGDTPPQYGLLLMAKTGLVAETAATTPAGMRAQIRRQIELRDKHRAEVA